LLPDRLKEIGKHTRPQERGKERRREGVGGGDSIKWSSPSKSDNSLPLLRQRGSNV